MYSKIMAFQTWGTGKVITLECENKNEHIFNMKCLSRYDIFNIQYLDNDDDYTQYKIIEYLYVSSDYQGGWKINETRCNDEDVYFHDDKVEEEINDYLIDNDYINYNVFLDKLIIENIGDIIEVSYAKNNKPICRFEKVII